ncbi:MAG: hypothetical protein SOZ34_10240 [Clostridia bacterium]|nr:hypothetical protein [Clostridia bacterium]
MKKSGKLMSALTAACILLSAAPGFAEENTDNIKTVTYDKTNHVSYVSYTPPDVNSRVYINNAGAFPAYNNVLYADFDNIKYCDYITGAVLEMPGGLTQNKNIVIRFTANEAYMESDNMPEPGVYYWEGTAEDPDGADDNDVCYTYFSKIAKILNGGVPNLRRNTTKTGSYSISSSADDYTTYTLTKGGIASDLPEIINTSLTKTTVDGTNYYSTANLPLTPDSVGYNLENQTSISVSGQMKFDLSKISGLVDRIKNSNGRVAFMSRGGGNINFDFSKAKLHLTYDMTSIASAIEAEIAAADTTEKVKKVVEDYNAFIGIDTTLISNMDYAYAEVAKNTASAGYTLETFKTAVEEAAKAYIRTYIYEQDNYVIYNQYDAGYAYGLYVNQPVVRVMGNNRSVLRETVHTKQWQFMSSFDIKNVDAVKKIAYKSTWNKVGENDINFITNVTGSFPLSVKSGLNNDEENKKRFSDNKTYNPKALKTVRNAANGNTVTVGTDSFDCTGRIEDLKEIYKTADSATLSIAISGGESGSAWSLLDMPTLEVEYDMTAVMDGFNTEVSNADNADELKNVVEKYNKFIGVNTNALVNMENVYSELLNNNYTFDTIEQLKEDFNTAAAKYLITVTYDKPSEYIIYKKPGSGSWNGHITTDLALVNTPFYMTDTNNTYFNADSGSELDSYYSSIILGYDIPNPQAVTDVEFTAKAKLRAAGDIDTKVARNCRVAWDLCDEPITQAGVGYYYDDSEKTDDVYDNIKSYYESNKATNTTVYNISDIVEEKVQTPMQIPSAVKDELQAASENAKRLALIFNSDFKRNVMSPTSEHTLKITYDMTALTEGERAFETNGFKANSVKADDSAVLLNDGARVELTQTQPDIEKDTEIAVIAAAYNNGKLVKALQTTITAPGYMGKTIVTINGFNDVEYDGLKIMTLEGLQNIKPLSLSKNISLE